MTRIVGSFIKASPCCELKYSTPRYASMNFMAAEYWTDGYRDRSLMPNDHGLRKCMCGRYFLLKEMHLLGEAEESDLPVPIRVQVGELPDAILHSRCQELEVAARMDYWQHLNHSYRDVYRSHRDAEDAAAREAWERDHPDNRSTLERQRGTPRSPKYSPPASRRAFPPFEPTSEQMDNMSALLGLLDRQPEQTARPEVLIELCRELSLFGDAARLMTRACPIGDGVLHKVLGYLISEQINAPARYAG